MRECCLNIFGKDTDWTPINYFVDAEEETWFVILESKIILKYLFKPSLKTDFWKTRPQFLSKLQFSSHDTAPFLENLPISGNWTGIVFQNLVWPEPDSKSINRFLDVFSRNQPELSGKTHNVSLKIRKIADWTSFPDIDDRSVWLMPRKDNPLI